MENLVKPNCTPICEPPYMPKRAENEENIEIKSKLEIQLLLNKDLDAITIINANDSEKQFHLILSDISGNIILDKNLILKTNINLILLPQKLVNGVYLYQLLEDSKIINSGKFINE